MYRITPNAKAYFQSKHTENVSNNGTQIKMSVV